MSYQERVYNIFESAKQIAQAEDNTAYTIAQRLRLVCKGDYISSLWQNPEHIKTRRIKDAYLRQLQSRTAQQLIPYRQRMRLARQIHKTKATECGLPEALDDIIRSVN